MSALKFKKVAFLLLAAAYFNTSNGLNTDSVYASIKGVTDSVRVDSLVKLARSNVIEGDPSHAVFLARKALQEAYSNSFLDLVPKARFYLAAGYDEQEVYDSSLYHYDVALEEMKGTAMESWRVHALINIATTHEIRGNYAKSLEYNLEILEWAKQENDTGRIAMILSDIGYTYDRLKNYPEAIAWNRKALRMFRIMNEEFSIAFVLGRIGIAFDDLGQYDSAHYYNKQSLALARIMGADQMVQNNLSNIGNTYSKQEKWEEAKEVLEESINMPLDSSRIPKNRAVTHINLGFVYSALGRFKESREQIVVGMRKALELGDIRVYGEGFYRMHQLFKKQNNADSALFYYQQYEIIEDSIYNVETSAKIADIREKYESDKKEQKIEFQELKLKESAASLNARRNLNWILVLTVVLVIVFSLWFYNRVKARKNAEMQQAIIVEKERGIRAVIEAQEEERKRISKDLHDSVGQQLSGLKMGLQKLTKSTPDPDEVKEKLINFTSILSQSADEVRTISHQMMPRALTELGLIPALEDMLNKSLGTAGIAHKFEHMNMVERLEERVEISLYRVCQELINNVIKHSNATEVMIQLFLNQQKVIMIVEDNGKGMESDSGNQGQGLMNIERRLSTIEGEVNFEASPNSGTLATIRIPLN